MSVYLEKVQQLQRMAVGIVDVHIDVICPPEVNKVSIGVSVFERKNDQLIKRFDIAEWIDKEGNDVILSRVNNLFKELGVL